MDVNDQSEDEDQEEERSISYTIRCWDGSLWQLSLRLLVDRGTRIHVLPQTESSGFHGLLVMFPHRVTERLAAAAAAAAAAEDDPPWGAACPEEGEDKRDGTPITICGDLRDETLRALYADLCEQQPLLCQMMRAQEAGAPAPELRVRIKAAPYLARRLVRGFAPAAVLLDLYSSLEADANETRRDWFAWNVTTAVGLSGEGRVVCVRAAYAHEIARLVPITWSIDSLSSWSSVLPVPPPAFETVRDAMRPLAEQVSCELLRSARTESGPSAIPTVAGAVSFLVSCDAPPLSSEPSSEPAALHEETVRQALTRHLGELAKRRAAGAVLADAWCRFAGAPRGPTARYLGDLERGWRPAPEGSCAVPGGAEPADIARAMVSGDARRQYDSRRSAVLRDVRRTRPMREEERASARRMSLLDLLRSFPANKEPF